MHIVHLYDGHEKVYEGRGSVPGVVWNVAKETVTRDHDVTVLERQWDGLQKSTTHDDVRFERLSLVTGADQPWERVPYEEVTTVGGLSKLILDRANFARASLKHLKTIDFDILHVHLPLAANVLLTVAPRFRKRTVFTAHLGELRLDLLDSGEEDGSPSHSDQKRAEKSEPDVPGFLSRFSPDRYLATRVERTTVLNEQIKKAFVDRGIAEDRLTVIPNGVDINRFANVSSDRINAVRASYGIGERPLVLFVGTIMPRKGVLELVRAISSMVSEYNQTPQVIIAGERDLDEDYTQTVEDLIHDEGLEELVSLPGFVPAEDLPALYHVSDVFVVPSLEEGFGMTAIEAMAAGTPVVGTHVGGLPELIQPGIPGELVDPGAVEQLAKAISELLSNELVREAVAEKVRDRASEFSWTAIGGRFEEVYQEID